MDIEVKMEEAQRDGCYNWDRQQQLKWFKMKKEFGEDFLRVYANTVSRYLKDAPNNKFTKTEMASLRDLFRISTEAKFDIGDFPEKFIQEAQSHI
jgi:hypothetical protein